MKNLLKEDKKIMKHIFGNKWSTISNRKPKSERDYYAIKCESIALWRKHKKVRQLQNGINTYIGSSA